MYKRFCNNLINFLAIQNSYPGHNVRKQMAESLLPLTNVKAYMELKKDGNADYKAISNLIYAISEYSKRYSDLKRFVWELWAYGFDIEQHEEFSLPHDMDEIAKLVDLLLSTHYLIAS